MIKAEIKPGSEYAFREKPFWPSPHTPLQRLRIIEHAGGGRWKAEWIEPNPGRVGYVESGQLIVPWEEHRAFLKDETRAEELRNHALKCGYEPQSPEALALQQIFEDCGEQGLSFYRGGVLAGVLTGEPEAIERVRTRAGFDSAKKSALGYAYRLGVAHLPFEEAMELGRGLCAAEPTTILGHAQATERTWSQEFRDGAYCSKDLLNKYRPSWALMRQWAGRDAAIGENRRKAAVQEANRHAPEDRESFWMCLASALLRFPKLSEDEFGAALTAAHDAVGDVEGRNCISLDSSRVGL